MSPVFAVSNIAWPSNGLDNAISVLRSHGVEGIEIAPYNVFGKWDVSDHEIRDLKAVIDRAGLRCVALQGILYNVADAALFTSVSSRNALFSHLCFVARMANRLGATGCVFGAPKNRDPGDLQSWEAWDIAVDFFRKIAPVFADNGCAIAFEANAKIYGCRFVTGTRDALALVRDVNRAGFRLQIDTGTMFLNNENPDELRDVAAWTVHAHISEPNMQAIGTADVDHRSISDVLRSIDYRGALSIEMKSGPDWIQNMHRAIRYVKDVYLHVDSD